MFKHVIQDNVSQTHDIKSVTYSTHNHKHLHVQTFITYLIINTGFLHMRYSKLYSNPYQPLRLIWIMQG